MSWLGTTLGRLGIIASLVLALFGLRQLDKSNQRSIGRGLERASVEKATNEAVSKAARAGDKSVNGGGWGVQHNPHYRD